MRGALTILLLAAGVLPAAARRTGHGAHRHLQLQPEPRRRRASLRRTTVDARTTRRRAPWREIIQRVRPDILLLQEFDYDAAGAVAARFPG